uniref:Uncharacterized protein n=1 Tax=Prolemur simus TaxID=1328070 RepID=A0A8C8ZQH6_PROSS
MHFSLLKLKFQSSSKIQVFYNNIQSSTFITKTYINTKLTKLVSIVTFKILESCHIRTKANLGKTITEMFTLLFFLVT